jgi:hypothetical protein
MFGKIFDVIGYTLLAGAIAAVLGVGYWFYALTFHFDQAAYVKPRAATYYAARGFRVIGYEGYITYPTGRCYWYTTEREQLLYNSCLMRWGDELHEYDLKPVGGLRVNATTHAE